MRALSPPGVIPAGLAGRWPVLCLRPMKARIASIVLASLVFSGCSSMHAPKIWPFYKKPKPAPEAVHELELVNADGTPATYPQYWARNTLIIDLTGVTVVGRVTARRLAAATWPARVGVRVRPGSVQQTEIQCEARNVLRVVAEGTLPVDLEFAPSVYRPSTAAIYINWGYIPRFGEVWVEPDKAGFVSPTVVPPRPEGEAP